MELDGEKSQEWGSLDFLGSGNVETHPLFSAGKQNPEHTLVLGQSLPWGPMLPPILFGSSQHLSEGLSPLLSL
jgi:hypothetical protein